MAQSSRGLFEATRAKPDRGPALPIDLPEQRAPEVARRKDDFYPTGQPEAVRALIAAERDYFDQSDTVWEPAVGDGAMARELMFCNVLVIGSDIVDRGWPSTIVRSFYDWDHAPARAIVTNPPYCEINARDGHGRWLRHTLALEGWDYCALLLSWDWPAARKNGLAELLDANPFAYCYLMRWKLDFTGEGSPPQRNAWFVWRRDHAGPPEFRWLDRVDARQRVLGLEG